MATDESILKSVVSLVRDSSVSRLKTLSGRDDISISEISTEPLVFAHWMSFILVSGEALRIIFKAHFMTEAAQFFAAKTYGTSPENVSISRALDFFREYSNLTAGKIKTDLDLNGVRVGASLPGLIRGFDEIFYMQQNGSTKYFWCLNSGVVKFVCSVHIEIFDKFVIKKVAEDVQANQGDVEYL